MATAAQIEANRRNAQRSTGPKTDEGKARVKLNAIKHGMTARTIMPVLPQEDPKELEDRTQQAITAMKPRNPLELDLVRRAVRLSGEIDRAERVGTAHLAHRVRMATRSGPETVSACELKKVHELGCKLFYRGAIELGYPDSTGDDHPAVIVRQLEESVEGCRWLLARWAELLNVLDRKAEWRDPEIIRFVGLQGKRGIEAYFDPELNSLFHAFDALGHHVGHKFWKGRRDMLPVNYKGGFMIVPYREIAPPPSDKTAALTLIRSVIERRVGRLEELLAEHEEIEADEADERYDRAALDCSPEFERHRRYQSARHRELMRTLETLRKMQKEEFGTGNGEPGTGDGKCQMADGGSEMASDKCQMAHGGGPMAEAGCQMANDEWQMTDEPCKVGAGGCAERESSEPVAEVSLGPIVAYDSNGDIENSTDDKIGILSHGGMAEVSLSPVVRYDSNCDIDDSTNDKTGILSHEGADAAGQPGQGDGVGQCLPDDLTTPQKAPNKANLESKERIEPQELKSEMALAERRKQSQFPEGGDDQKTEVARWLTGSADPPSSATAGVPVPDRRRVTRKPLDSRTAESGDLARTSATDSIGKKTRVNRNFAACQYDTSAPALKSESGIRHDIPVAPLLVAHRPG